MTECAWCATRTKDTYFSARYQRLAARRGKKRALVAIAAEMLKVVYHMLKDGTVYQELGSDYSSNRRKDAQIKYHREQLNKLLGEDSPENKSE
jgi:predicted transcriptional regulator